MIPSMRVWIFSTSKMERVTAVNMAMETMRLAIRHEKSEGIIAFIPQEAMEVAKMLRDLGSEGGVRGKIYMPNDIPMNRGFLMLGSGVTDSNTIEIYQGDKVKHPDVGVGKVVLLQGCLVIEWEESPTPSPLCGFELDGIQCKHLEIVGHIFEERIETIDRTLNRDDIEEGNIIGYGDRQEEV